MTTPPFPLATGALRRVVMKESATVSRTGALHVLLALTLSVFDLVERRSSEMALAALLWAFTTTAMWPAPGTMVGAIASPKW